MKFKYFRRPMREIEKSNSELENMIEHEDAIFEKDLLMDEMPDYHIHNDDYLQKESDRLEQEDLNEMFKRRIP